MWQGYRRSRNYWRRHEELGIDVLPPYYFFFWENQTPSTDAERNWGEKGIAIERGELKSRIYGWKMKLEVVCGIGIGISPVI